MSMYNKTSPYSNTGIVNGYLDVLTLVDIPEFADDPQYTLSAKFTHRPDLLAYELYNDPSFWWVFAVRNKEVIKDPIFDMVSGQTIFIPKLATIKNAIGNY